MMVLGREASVDIFGAMEVDRVTCDGDSKGCSKHKHDRGMGHKRGKDSHRKQKEKGNNTMTTAAKERAKEKALKEKEKVNVKAFVLLIKCPSVPSPVTKPSHSQTCFGDKVNRWRNKT